MESAEIRSRFLRFFEERGHTVVPSAPLPLADPTLLLVNAGMVPFKPYFLGEQTPPYPRATSVQKCVRTLDIDEVGKTTRHASFFQMAGNFSFGDYFKEGAIPLAWELLTNAVGDGGYGFDRDRLWVTVYQDDDEAAEIWHRDVGVPAGAHPAARPQRQLLVDGRARPGRPVLGDLLRPRSRVRRGGRPDRRRGPLPRDLEPRLHAVRRWARSAARRTSTSSASCRRRTSTPAWASSGWRRVLQGVDNLYEIDTTRTILDRAAELTGKRVRRRPRRRRALRVVADHARTAVMLIGDRWCPGNEGRGYVLRRIMRRVVRSMRLLGGHDPTMRELVVGVDRGDGPAVPRARARRGAHPHRRRGRGGRVPADPARPARRSSTSRRRERQAVRRDHAWRRRRVQAARHLRLPDRPHARDGGRAGPRRSTRTASAG